MAGPTIGRVPNNCFFHAETTVLLRAAQSQGGRLDGQVFTVMSDRAMSSSCLKLMPYIAWELGNPTVTFVGPTHTALTLRDGVWVELGKDMRKWAYFDSAPRLGWPAPKEIERYFFAPSEHQWFHTGGNDSALLERFEHGGAGPVDYGPERISVELEMWGKPGLGILLIYSKQGGGFGETLSSKGDLTRLGERMRTLHGDPMPVGLFISFEKAWPAVKEFIETDGRRPQSIDWIANAELPANSFPDPH